MNLREEIESLLPTRLTRWLALLTAALLSPAFVAPRFLQPLIAPNATEAEIVLLQILVSGVVAVFGTFFVLLAILFHLRSEEKNRREVLKELNDDYQKEQGRRKQRDRI